MSTGQNFQSTLGCLRSAMRRPPSLTTCIAIYYVVLILFGLTIDVADPLNGLLNLLLFTHLFILVAPFAHGPSSILVIVGVPVAIALCAVWLSGWWRVGSIMFLIASTHLLGLFSAGILA